MADGGLAAKKNTVQFVDSPSGRKIEYTIVGRCGPEDPVMLFCHGNAFPGMPATWVVFAAQNDDVQWKEPKAMELCESFPWAVVVAERAGYGQSTMNKRPEDWTYDDAAVDYMAVLDALKVERFAVLGASSGGCNALYLAYKHPDRVKAIMLNCANANFGPGMPQGKKKNAALPEGEVTYTNPSAGMQKCCACCRWNPCCCCCCCCPKGLWADSFVELKAAPYRCEEIQCPVVVVQCLQDTVVDHNCSRYHASVIPNSKLVMVDDKCARHVTLPGSVWTEETEHLRGLAIGKPLQQEMA